jgi:molybdopterin-guanine dinucleotide biosynthesis protein A
MNVGGIVLCGGRSSRMGKPKAWLPLGREFMLQRVVRIVSETVSPVVVVAASNQELPPLPPEVTVARDVIEGRGPLQGIAAGIEALTGRCDAAFVSACDAPFLEPAFIRRMIDFLGDHSICAAQVAGYHHPLAAVYRIGVLDSVQRLLAANRLRPMDLFETTPTRIVGAADLVDIDPDLRSLRNLNSPDDYQTALDALQETTYLSE